MLYTLHTNTFCICRYFVRMSVSMCIWGRLTMWVCVCLWCPQSKLSVCVFTSLFAKDRVCESMCVFVEPVFKRQSVSVFACLRVWSVFVRVS